MEEANERQKLIERYFETNSTMVVADLAEVLSSDIVAYYPSKTIRGKENYKKHVEGTFSSARKVFSFNRVFPTKIVVQGNKAIARWTFQYKIGCCGTSQFDGYNEYDFKEENGKILISMVRTEQIKPTPWYVKLFSCGKRE